MNGQTGEFIGNIPLDGSNNFTQDGYLVVNRCATVGSEGNAKTFCSEIIPHSIACADGTCNAINDYVFNN